MTETRTPQALTPVEFARWIWRQLTSMRTALLLLLLLALGSVPGSVVPQQSISPSGVAKWKDAHPTLAPVFDRLGMFDVYSSAWFSAIYLLLMVSLVGCILPRLRVYWRALRARPPAPPRNLDRLPAYTSFETDGVADERIVAVLRRRRYRVTTYEDGVSAERGRLREAGNLVFHLAVVVALVGFAWGQLYGYKGGAIVLAGSGWSNDLTQYDEFDPGRLVDTGKLAPLHFDVDDFEVTYVTSGSEAGQPSKFHAAISYTEKPGGETKHFDLRVNHPLSLRGVSVFLVSNGYAPIFKVTDGDGNVVSNGPAIFLPQDSSYQSVGVVKVPEARPTQLGFEGFLYPTYGFTMATGPFSSWPDLLDPEVSLRAYAGDLGLDKGTSQNVYVLDKTHAPVVMQEGKEGSTALADQLLINLKAGETATLPNGLGSIEFVGVQRWIKIQVSDSPGDKLALGGVVAGVIGLIGSLFVRPRRVWVRRRDRLVEVGGLDRSGNADDLDDEVELIAKQLQENA